jgi:hypothetical protein
VATSAQSLIPELLSPAICSDPSSYAVEHAKGFAPGAQAIGAKARDGTDKGSITMAVEGITAFPLCWPPAHPRQPKGNYLRSPFTTNHDKALRELKWAIGKLNGSELIISTNLTLRSDGSPAAVKFLPKDPGVAVYFKRRGKKLAFACDTWATIPENLHAIFLTIEAIRGIERWGSGQMLEAAFTGFVALPAPEQPFQVLGVRANASPAEIKTAHQALAAKHHPDRPGGNADTMARVNAARDAMLVALEPNHQ